MPSLSRQLRSMATATYKYVILGAGNSAGYAARQFVQDGSLKPNDLCLVGAEPYHPYERPALSKAVLMKKAVRLPGFHTCVGGGGDRQAPEWYQEHGIVTVLGKPVVAVDAANKQLTLEDGQLITASHALILATGADPIKLTRTEGHNLNGIHYLRDNDQAVALYDALQANIGKTVIVVGGGYIGMEVSAAALSVGCKVKMIFPEAHIMPRLFTPEIAVHYEKVYEEKGAVLLKNGRLCKAFLGDDDGNIRGVRMCQNGQGDIEEEGSLVVVGVGARPTTALYKDQLEMDERGGIVVDSSLKTSVDGVYAIGDIATFPLKIYNDRPVRVEHVKNARQSAAHAVKAIVTPAADPYDYLPYFYSRVFHLSWQFYGDNVGECIVVGDFNPQLLAVWVQEDGNVKGIFMESPSAEDSGNMTKIAREGKIIDKDEFKKSSSVEDAWKLLL